MSDVHRFTMTGAEFDAADEFIAAAMAHSLTPVVDDDYPEVRHCYEDALANLLTAMKANGRFEPGNRYGLTVASGETGLRILRKANEARQLEWDKEGSITLAYRGNELAGEAGEACNIIKKLERERLGIRGSRSTAEHLAAELADVVICADLIAMAEGIDLDAAVVRKFNATSEKVGLKTRMAER